MTNFNFKLLNTMALSAVSFSAFSAPITFQAGNDLIEGITAFDWAPSSVIAYNAGQAVANRYNTSLLGLDCTTGCDYQVYLQGNLSAFLADGVALGSHLGVNYEMTYQMSFTMNVSDVRIIDGVGAMAFFTFVESDNNYMDVYFDGNVNADYYTGLGFTDGTQVFSSHLEMASEESSADSNFWTYHNNANTAIIDNIGGVEDTPNDWDTQLSVTGSGTTGAMRATDITYDENYFTDGIVSLLLNNITQELPFSSIEPSRYYLTRDDGMIDAMVETGDVNGDVTIDSFGFMIPRSNSVTFQADINSPVLTTITWGEHNPLTSLNSLLLIGLGFLIFPLFIREIFS